MSDASAVEPVIGAERQIDAVIAQLAEEQHGVVGRAQLLAVGVGRRAIGHRLECGRLHPLHRGVYAVGHRVVSREGRWMAAVLASGQGAVLSHRSAGALWGVLDTTATRHGVPALRRFLASWHVGATLTRSELEERFIAFLDARGFDRPEVNVWLETAAGWFEADFLWRRHRVMLARRPRHLAPLARAPERAGDRPARGASAVEPVIGAQLQSR